MSEYAGKIRLEEIISNKASAVRVTTNTTVQEAAKILAKKNFRSVPIWDEEERRFVGFIDEMDLVEYAVVLAHSGLDIRFPQNSKLQEKFGSFTPEELQRFSLGNHPVEIILSLPGAERRRCHVFQSNARLINAMQIIHEYERVLVRHSTVATNSKVKLFVGRLMTRIHRVMDYRICTQTDILRFLFSHMKDLKEENFQQSRVIDCGKLNPLVWLSVDERAIDGYLRMIDANVSAAAVIDRDGRLLATLSSSELRGMTNEKLQLLMFPVMQFLSQMLGSVPSPLTCKADDNLLETIKKMLRATTRRCWVVDEELRPLGQLSMGNIIQYIITIPCEHL